MHKTNVNPERQKINTQKTTNLRLWGHILETFLRHFPKIFLCQMT